MNKSGYTLLPTEPVEVKAVQEASWVALPKDVLILICITLAKLGTDHDVRKFTMVCRTFYALREQLSFHGVLAPLQFKSMNHSPLGRGHYASANLLQAIGVFPNNNILGADNTQLYIWSPDGLALLHRVKPRRSHRVLHAAILPDNSIAVISHKMAGCCSREKVRFDCYDPVRYRRLWDLTALLKYPHDDEQINKQYALAIDINGMPVQIHWRRVKELCRVEKALMWIESVKMCIEYPYNDLQKIFEFDSEDEGPSISCPNGVRTRDRAPWPLEKFPVRAYVQFTDTRMLGYHAIEDQTPVRNPNQVNMQRNCLILWNSPDYLKAKYLKSTKEKAKEESGCSNNNAI